MAAYTTATLLTSVERQSFSPANQNTFSTEDILELGNEVIQTTILPIILGVREEFFVDYYDYTIVSGTAAYSIPSRAIGMAIRDVQLVDANGNVKNLIRVSLDQLYLRSTTAATPTAFYLQNDSIVLNPPPSATTGTLRIYYSLRPGRLIEASDAAVISSIDTLTKIVTVSTIPSTWVTGNVFDIIQRTGSNSYLDIDLTSVAVSGTSITLPSLPTGLAVGDYIALSEESPLVQLPPDFRPILATLIAAEMLISMGQPDGDKIYAKGMNNLHVAAKLLTPRVVGEEELITPDWS